MTTPFNKSRDDLTIDDKEMLDLAFNVLKNGDRLYGDDLSHIEWAMGFAVSELESVREPGDTVITLLEIGLDDSGFFIGFVNLTGNDNL